MTSVTVVTSAGDTLFAFGYVQSNTMGTESTEDDSKEDGSGGSTGIGVLIGMVLGALAIVSLIGVIVYREWSRRQMSIGQVLVNEDQGRTISNPRLHVDHVADHQVADVDASLSQCSTASDLEASELTGDQSFSALTATGSPLTTVGSSDAESSQGLPSGMNMNADGSPAEESMDAWNPATTDFEAEEPAFERSLSELSAVSSEAHKVSCTFAPSA